MSGCCTARGYRWIFSPGRAAAEARRYRRRGLDRTSRGIVDLLVERGVEGSTVLEVGGGVGAVQIELLRSGAVHATSVELTPTYEQAAAALLREFDLVDRVERSVADFAEIGAEISPSDIVVLNRVVCCYPDMPTLTAAAADHTRGVLVMSFPKVTWWTRALLNVGNAGFTLARRQFRLFLHPPAGIRMTAELHGLRLLMDRRGSFWQVMAFAARGAAGP